MILCVEKLGPEGLRLKGEDPVEALDWVPTPRDVIEPAGPMRWELLAKRFENELFVTGYAEALFRGQCCRCGGPLERVWGDKVEFSMELKPGDCEVDLTSELRETILLALPSNPLCSEDCPGICPHCGKRLAEGPCSCKEPALQNPWSALDNLLK